MLTVALIADVHFGPVARFDGKLRKLSHQALEYVQRFVEHMRTGVEPDLIVNLGDIVEDEDPEADWRRYVEGLQLLSQAPGRLVNVAGNHDRIHLDASMIRRAWGEPPTGPLYYSFDHGPMHFVVLYSHERKDRDVRVGPEQMRWLANDLRATNLPTMVFMHHSAAEQDLRGNRWFAHAPHICLVEDRQDLRRVLRDSAKVVAVFNGHLHWNHLDLIDSIPFVTLQSLVENVHDDEPGLAAQTHAVVRMAPQRMIVEVAGAQPARYQFDDLG